MAKLKIFGSGSSGNSLAIFDRFGRYIILDCGLPFQQIIKELDYDLSKCLAVFVTHAHTDHTKALGEFWNRGVPCYGNADVCEKFDCYEIIEPLRMQGFKVGTFSLVHDIPCNGYVVDIDGVRLLYAVDTTYIPCLVRGVHYAIVEANYDNNIILDSVANGQEIRSHNENHQEINDCIDYLKRIYSPQLQQIILAHISNGSGDAKEFQRRVQKELCFSNVKIANALIGIEQELSATEF